MSFTKKLGDYLRRGIKLFKRHNLLFDINTLAYAYKRNNWMFDLSRYISDYEEVEIDRPIFLLGTQGAGLTLVARMLRRNKEVVSVTGNYNYWAGADEMNSVLGPILPEEFKSIEHRKPYPEQIKVAQDWLCGIDKYVDMYRNTEAEVTEEIKTKVRKILRWTIARHKIGQKGRFIDKSQTFTLKVAFINKILEDCCPKFILIPRNPYASCYREAKGDTYSEECFTYKYSFKEKLEFACQHWSNYMRYALEDSEKVDDFMTINFETVLQRPEFSLKEICEFADLKFKEDMLPAPEDEIPFGCKRRNRWYPLKSEVNQKYLKEMNQEHIGLIDSYCGEYAEKFGYNFP